MKVAAIGLVVLLFVAAFAGYWSLEAARPTSVASTPLFTYEQTGRYTYVAALANNTLYNTSTLTPGNGTLFTTITSWVNLSFTYRLTVSHVANAGINMLMTIAVETPVWTKTLGTVGATAYVVDGITGTVSASYALNVSNVTGLVASIEKQTGYQPSAYSVELSPSIGASVVVGTNGTSFNYLDPLTLNFSAGQITPSHLFASQFGSYSPGGGDPTVRTFPVLPVGILTGALAGIAVLGYLTYRSYRRDAGPDLEAITRPFQEAIVDTATPPPAGSRVEVPTWTDLVKVADTLGVPILRVRSGGGASSDGRALFYVLSDGLAYVYRYGAAVVPRATVPATGSARPPASATPSRGNGASGDVPAPTVARNPSAPSAAVARAWNLDAFVRSAESVQRTINSLGNSSPAAADSERLLLRSIELARRGRLDAAWPTLEGARFRADLSSPARPSGPAAPGPRRPGT